MSNKNQSADNFAADSVNEEKYPTNNFGTDKFSFFWLKLAGFGMMIYYISEMVNRVLFLTLEIPTAPMWRIWRIVDSAYLTLMFVPIGLQVLSWKRNNLGMESRKKINRIFISIIGAGVFVTMYEILTELRAELNYSHQGDLTVPFLLMIMLHVYGFVLLKNLINMIGRYKEVSTGTSIFYLLFAVNPFVRYLLPFIILIFAQLGGSWAIIFFIYSELVMTYISAVIAIGFFIYIWKDSSKIDRGHLLLNHDKKQRNNGLPEIQGIKLIEFQDKVIEVPIKQNFSIFCPECGVVVYDDAKKCQSCSAKI
ncbi:MAG: zinc ribbon domain-containing protein [Candidatus Heimdallarchaeota archaeon]|nr:zinc ribbon domain-containing protein [Candidatus Heimdallarchaeota archaeon]